MGYVIKEVRPGVFELVFEEEAPAPAGGKAKDGDDGDDDEKEKEEEKQEEKPKEPESAKPEEEPEEDLPVAEAGVLKSSALSRLIRDLKEIQESPLPTVNAAPLENNIFEWHANILGSSETVFCGMVFHLIMTFPETYPMKPPKVRMMNYIDHPNVFGEFICLDMLEDGMWNDPIYRNKPYTGWTTAYSVQSILVQLQTFFSTEAYKDGWTEETGVKKATESIAKLKCSCGHHKDNFWPIITPEAIKQVKIERNRLLVKAGKKPAFEIDDGKKDAGSGKGKPAAPAKESEQAKKTASPAKGKQPAGKKEDKEKGAEGNDDKAEKKETEKEKEKEKEGEKDQKKEAAAPGVASKPADATLPKPIVTKLGLIPLRRYLPDQGVVVPTVGKRIGFGDKTTLELHWQKDKLNKRYRDSEIELKSTSDGYVYELLINEPPPRSETKDIIYFWGEVYPIDEVETEDNDPIVAARRAAGIPLAKEMNVKDLLAARPLSIPKADSLTIVLTENSVGKFRAKGKHSFKTVYNLEHYENVKASSWQLYAMDEKNPKNLLVLNLKSNKFNLHFLSSVQYFVHVDKKPEPKAEAAGKKGRGDTKGKGGREQKDGQAAGRGAGRGGAAKPEGAGKEKAGASEAPTKGPAAASRAPAGRGKGKNEPEVEGTEQSGKRHRDQEEEVPTKKYVPPPTGPLFISANFGGAPPVSKEQRNRDRKGKDKLDPSGGRRGRRVAPVGSGKGKEKEGAPAPVKAEEKPLPEPQKLPAAGDVKTVPPALDGDAGGEKAPEQPKAEVPQQPEDGVKGPKGGRSRKNRRGKGKAEQPLANGTDEAGAEQQPVAEDKQPQKKKGEKRGGKTLNFDKLPFEIKSHIFSFLAKRDLYRAATVSHEFEALSKGILAKSELFCYHTKLNFQEDTLGIGVSYKYYPGSKNIESISSQLDLLSYTAFHLDKVRKSVWKVRFNDWLPLYLSYKHGLKAIPLCKASIARIMTGSEVGFEPKMAITVFTKLMNTMIVDLMKCDSWASEKALEGYFAFHHWLLVFLELYPQLLDWVNETIRNFIEDERYRTKRVVPALGEFIPLLALTDKYSWHDVSEAYILENFDRNQKWVLQQFPPLGNLANEKEPVDKTRIIKTQIATTVSQRLLMFHVFFLNHIVKPKGRSVADIKRMYDESYGRPTDRMKFALQQKIKELQKISNWIEFFTLIDFPLPTPRKLTGWLRASVRNSARKRYHNSADYVGKTRQKKKHANGEQEDKHDAYDVDF